MRLLTHTVTPQEAGLPVRTLLRRQLRISGSFLAKLKWRPGAITLNGIPVIVSTRTEAGDVLAAADAGNEQARRAIDMYVYRVQKAICGFYGGQYHPEVNHTEHGTDMIRNFLYEVCGAAGDWTMGDYKETANRQLREKVGDG